MKFFCGFKVKNYQQNCGEVPSMRTCFFLILFVGSLFVGCTKWNAYYKNKIYKPPMDIVQNASMRFTTPGTAIDLGCGVGNEAVFMLHHGWSVWAIDAESQALNMLQKRNDITALDRLHAVCMNFEDVPAWKKLPCVDLLYASYSLPFCGPEHFYVIWRCVQEHIKSGGRFAGHFFGKGYQGFSAREMKTMTFLDREQVLALFQDFDIEYFNEIDEDGISGTQRAVHAHIFEVIALKR